MLKMMYEFVLVGLSESRLTAEEYLKEFGYISTINLSRVNNMYGILCVGDESKKDEFLKRLEEDPDFEFRVFKASTSMFSPPQPRFSHNNPFL